MTKILINFEKAIPHGKYMLAPKFPDIGRMEVGVENKFFTLLWKGHGNYYEI
jgi:hypothetical protein